MTDDVMFSARQVPWMKLGALVEQPVTAAEAARLAGIDFNVREVPVYHGGGADGTPVLVPSRKALVREDTGEWLSFVSKDYPVLQYGEAFDFLDGINPHFVAAGNLRKGRQAFMVVAAPAGLSVDPFGGEDPHQLFFTLRTSHDCSRAIEVMATPLRGRCMNQLNLATFRRGVPHRWVVTHTGDLRAKLVTAHNSVSQLEAYAEAYRANVLRLAEISVTDELATKVLHHILPDKPRRDETVQRILSNWHLRPTVGFPGTGWGLVNAVSEYYDWDRMGGSAESRLLAALQGQTHRAINRAASLLLTRSS